MVRELRFGTGQDNSEKDQGQIFKETNVNKKEESSKEWK